MAARGLVVGACGRPFEGFHVITQATAGLDFDV
jgi:hypothetical protein